MPFEAAYNVAHCYVKWRISGVVSYRTDLVILNSDRILLNTHTHSEGEKLWISDRVMEMVRRPTNCFRG
jgi:hypothetical protein